MGDTVNPLIAANEESLREAYESVRTDPDVAFAIVGYTGRSEVGVTATGGSVSDGIAVFDDGEVQYGYFRVNFDATDGVSREKFVFVSWVGENAKPLAKGKTSVHLPIVRSIFRDAAVNIKQPERDQLTEDYLIEEVKRVNY